MTRPGRARGVIEPQRQAEDGTAAEAEGAERRADDPESDLGESPLEIRAARCHHQRIANVYQVDAEVGRVLLVGRDQPFGTARLPFEGDEAGRGECRWVV